MRSDDEVRLRAQLEALQRSIPGDMPPDVQRARSVSPAVVPAVVASALIVALVASQWLMTSRDGSVGEGPSVSPSLASGGPSTSPGLTSSADPTASPSGEAQPTWTVFELDVAGGAEVTWLSVAGERVYATGGESGPGGWLVPVAFFSEDGRTWTRATVDVRDAPATPEEDLLLGPIAVSGERLVGLGQASTRGPGDAPPATVTYASDDGGLTWSELGRPDLDPTLMAAIAAGGPGFVAVGQSVVNDPCCPGGRRAAVVVSVDGNSWESVTSQGFDDGAMYDVATDGSRLVAVGARTGSEGADVPAAWSSTDGREWQVISLPIEAGSGSAQDVTSTPAGFVAVGWEVGPTGAPLPVAWTSPDGGSWEREVIDPTTDAWPDDATSGNLGVVAVGVEPGTEEWIAWRRDAGTWGSLPVAGNVLGPVVALGDRYIVLLDCDSEAQCAARSIGILASD